MKKQCSSGLHRLHRCSACRWLRCGTYRITARPQFRVKLAACGGRAGGSGAERRSRNSVRVRSYALGSGAPVAVRPRARTRVASPAVSTPDEYPGDKASSTVLGVVVRISVVRGPRTASSALPARWPPCSGGGAWRCCGWSRSARLPPAHPASARRRRPPPAPRKMRRRRPLARSRPLTPPSYRRRHRPRRPTRQRPPRGLKEERGVRGNVAWHEDVGYQGETPRHPTP
ncbi:unnamed protein product [Diatraea saccharalis]|uniref:Uncharacterized protein n=1 Tax=Diatraea saccharalis TaxID=40085 RepID=A0A9N9WGD8_9NEOP|nr:unnamed protein product [Diatraea saccharalis]